MTPFVIIAALMTGVALLFVLPTLLRKDAGAKRHAQFDEVNLTVLRDQLRELDADLAAATITADGYRSARQELERRVAEDVQPGAAGGGAAAPVKRWTVALAGLSIPLVAASLYFLLGAPAGLDPAQVAAAKDPAHEVTEAQMEGMIAKLALRLKNEPNNAEGWSMLARSYGALGKFDKAADAYAQLVKVSPTNADALADYADVLAMSLNKTLQGEPEKLIARALVIDPKNIKALSLSGAAAFQRNDFQAAATQWKLILPLVPQDSEIARSTAGSIAEAQSRASGGSAPAQAPVTAPVAATVADALALKAVQDAKEQAAAPAATVSAVAAAKVEGSVALDPALRAKVADTDSVFIFARAASGPKFPLAVLRKQVKDLPVNFTLDDSMSMVANAKLSNYPLVVVGARISKTGDATASVGDLEGMSEPVKPGASGLKILINSQRK